MIRFLLLSVVLAVTSCAFEPLFDLEQAQGADFSAKITQEAYFEISDWPGQLYHNRIHRYLPSPTNPRTGYVLFRDVDSPPSLTVVPIIDGALPFRDQRIVQLETGSGAFDYDAWIIPRGADGGDQDALLIAYWFDGQVVFRVFRVQLETDLIFGTRLNTFDATLPVISRLNPAPENGSTVQAAALSYYQPAVGQVAAELQVLVRTPAGLYRDYFISLTAQQAVNATSGGVGGTLSAELGSASFGLPVAGIGTDTPVRRARYAHHRQTRRSYLAYLDGTYASAPWRALTWRTAESGAPVALGSYRGAVGWATATGLSASSRNGTIVLVNPAGQVSGSHAVGALHAEGVLAGQMRQLFTTASTVGSIFGSYNAAFGVYSHGGW